MTVLGLEGLAAITTFRTWTEQLREENVFNFGPNCMTTQFCRDSNGHEYAL